MQTQTKTRKLLLTALTVTVVGSIVAFGTFSAFSSTTENPDNQFSAGTVNISDNDADTAIYNVSGAKPGPSSHREKCIQVTYTGSLDSRVKLYLPDAVNGNIADYVDLQITSGAGEETDCSDFVADTNVYNGDVGAFQAAHNSFANGLVDNPPASTNWQTNDTVTYKMEVELQDNNLANDPSGTGYASGIHKYVWEAQNQ